MSETAETLRAENSQLLRRAERAESALRGMLREFDRLPRDVRELFGDFAIRNARWTIEDAEAEMAEKKGYAS